MAKRIIAGLWVVLVLLLSVLLLADISNKNFIQDFKNGIFEQNTFGFLGFWEPYVNHYNRGNLYYSLGDYERAIEEYQEALKTASEKPEDCMARINYALSLVVPLDLESLTGDNADEYLSVLYEARDLLCENGCANSDSDKGGHDSDAQRLKNEIEELINLIENPPEPTEEPTPTDSSNPSDQPTPSDGVEPSGEPTPSDGAQPSGEPTPSDGVEPSVSPEPSEEPEPSSGVEPSGEPTPTNEPETSGTPSPAPTIGLDPSGTPMPVPPSPTPVPPDVSLSELMFRAIQNRYGVSSVTDVWNYGYRPSW